MIRTSIVVMAMAAAAATGTPLAARDYYSSSMSTENYGTATSTWATAARSSGYGSNGGGKTATPNPPIPSGLVASLLTADSAADRDNLLAMQDPTHGVFDFNPAANPNIVPGQGGQVDLANRANFPILTDLGVSAAALFFNPCGLVPPHIHPRATEFFVLATDSLVTTGFVAELGALTQQNTTLTQFQGTVFPQGAIHFLQNQGCEPAVGISGLGNEDPGADFIAQGFFGSIEPDVIDATLGFPKQIDSNNFAAFKAGIPAPFVLGIESCLQRCGIAY